MRTSKIGQLLNSRVKVTLQDGRVFIGQLQKGLLPPDASLPQVRGCGQACSQIRAHHP